MVYLEAVNRIGIYDVVFNVCFNFVYLAKSSSESNGDSSTPHRPTPWCARELSLDKEKSWRLIAVICLYGKYKEFHMHAKQPMQPSRTYLKIELQSHVSYIY